ncbi:acyltransferase family protein [Kozakia baliensis]|uniref:Uncharacterized protein n=1 Tax=Kozakia baliensis TaxID=153496 RepID=A0A1D8UYQ2_9PROT|nr:acyltransferase family protein [Kozakia baliensis]AOX18803.1 hypothetical protein A0U89_16025 [Kozakia baliensis]GEL65796.1 glucan biosynthesis protein [Kozakia baliensis]
MTGETTRLHGLDAMRLFLMVFGIPYHAALIYGLHTSWLFHAPESSWGFAALAGALHSFRMGAFFLLSGFFSALTIGRRDVQSWMSRRAVQLLVPLAVSMAILTPPQLLLFVMARDNLPISAWQMALPGVVAILAHPNKLWVLHLWFLIDLFLVCCVFAGSYRVGARAFRAPLDRLERFAIKAPRLLGVGLLAVLVGGTLVLQAMQAANHHRELNLFHDMIQIQSTLYYMMFFALGSVLYMRPAILRWFAAPGFLTGIMGLLAVLGCGVCAPSESHAAQVLLPALATVATILVSRWMFRLALEHFNEPNNWVGQVSGASYTVYLLHHPVVAMLGFICVREAVTPILSWLSIVAATTIVTVTFHVTIVNRSRVLAFLVNGRALRQGAHTLRSHTMRDA